MKTYWWLNRQKEERNMKLHCSLLRTLLSQPIIMQQHERMSYHPWIMKLHTNIYVRWSCNNPLIFYCHNISNIANTNSLWCKHSISWLGHLAILVWWWFHQSLPPGPAWGQHRSATCNISCCVVWTDMVLSVQCFCAAYQCSAIW